MEEQILYTKYALLSPSDYLKLNEGISERLGFDLSHSTQRYMTITSPVDTNGLMVMEITAEVQINCPELIEGLTLVDYGQWTLAEVQPTTLEATGLTTEQVDWTLTHTALTKPNLEVIYLLDEPPTSEAVINQIVANGTDVIVPE